MRGFLNGLLAALVSSMAFAQTCSLVRNDTPVTTGVDAATFQRNITHFTFDLRGTTGGIDWTGAEVSIDVVGSGAIWHASDQRFGLVRVPNEDDEFCVVHNLNAPSLSFNATNNSRSRMYDTFFTAPGSRFNVDPTFATHPLSWPDPGDCPPNPIIVSNETRVRGLDAQGNEIPLKWLDAVNAPLNNTVLARLTFETAAAAPIVDANFRLFATIRGRVFSANNPLGNTFSFDLFQAQEDCNSNGVPDADDIVAGTSNDCDMNEFPDECQSSFAPRFTVQPVSFVHCGGTVASYNSAANGFPLSYQWRRNGVDLSDGPALDGGLISGASTSTLTIAPAGIADSGEYSVRVANNCSPEETISQPAILSITGNRLYFISNAGTDTPSGLSLASISGQSGAFLRTLSAPGSVGIPNGIAVDSLQNVYLVDSTTNRVIKYGWQSGEVLSTYSGSTFSPLVDPVGVVVSEDGAERWLYVTGRASNNVVRFNLDDPVQSSVFCDLEASGYTAPGALVLLPSGALLVAVEATSAVVEIGPGGSVARVAAAGCGLDAPSGLLLEPSGSLLVSSLGTNSVIRYDANGACVGTLVPSGLGGLSGPYGLFRTAAGELLVASNLTNQILRYDAIGGTYLGVFASELDGPRYFVPASLCSVDCNQNERPDVWDLALGLSEDCNANGRPDECESNLPQITMQPSNQDTCPSGTVTFTVTATGTGPLTYRWRQGAVAISTIVNPSAATATLVLTNVQPPDANGGSYDCIVTNPCGPVASNAATLSICDFPADLNCDAEVDLSDLATLLANFGRTDNPPHSAGEITGNGAIDLTDLARMLAAFGTSCP